MALIFQSTGANFTFHQKEAALACVCYIVIIGTIADSALYLT
jgi:hypothetical protein